jgi:hypothetical protein
LNRGLSISKKQNGKKQKQTKEEEPTHLKFKESLSKIQRKRKQFIFLNLLESIIKE